VADDPYRSTRIGGHEPSIVEHPDNPRESTARAWFIAYLPDALTGLRFALAGLWIALALTASEWHPGFAVIAAVASASDFLDGRLARRLGVAHSAGRWLDSIADVTFVLAALGCEAAAGSIPTYIPVLIALSFGQYAVDSILLHRAGTPVRSRLGHWGGVINYALVVALAFSAPGSMARALVAHVIPIIALFYVAAIIERALAYRSLAR